MLAFLAGYGILFAVPMVGAGLLCLAFGFPGIAMILTGTGFLASLPAWLDCLIQEFTE